MLPQQLSMPAAIHDHPSEKLVNLGQPEEDFHYRAASIRKQDNDCDDR